MITGLRFSAFADTVLACAGVDEARMPCRLTRDAHTRCLLPLPMASCTGWTFVRVGAGCRS